MCQFWRYGRAFAKNACVWSSWFKREGPSFLKQKPVTRMLLGISRKHGYFLWPKCHWKPREHLETFPRKLLEGRQSQSEALGFGACLIRWNDEGEPKTGYNHQNHPHLYLRKIRNLSSTNEELSISQSISFCIFTQTLLVLTKHRLDLTAHKCCGPLLRFLEKW